MLTHKGQVLFDYRPYEMDDAETMDCVLLSQWGDEESKGLLIRANIKLITKISRKYYPDENTLEFSDMIIAGCMGFLKGVDMYDFNRKKEDGSDHKLSTVVTPWIKQFCCREYQQKNTNVRYPEHVTDNRYKIRRLRREYAIKGMDITPEEIAEELNIKLYKVKGCLDFLSNEDTLNRLVSDSDKGEIQAIDTIESGERADECVDDDDIKQEIDYMLSLVSQDEADALRMTYYEDMKLGEIAKHIPSFNCRGSVFTAMKRAKEKIKHHYEVTKREIIY